MKFFCKFCSKLSETEICKNCLIKIKKRNSEIAQSNKYVGGEKR